jgi:hypothetical protein
MTAMNIWRMMTRNKCQNQRADASHPSLTIGEQQPTADEYRHDNCLSQLCLCGRRSIENVCPIFRRKHLINTQICIEEVTKIDDAVTTEITTEELDVN